MANEPWIEAMRAEFKAYDLADAWTGDEWIDGLFGIIEAHALRLSERDQQREAKVQELVKAARLREALEYLVKACEQWMCIETAIEKAKAALAKEGK